MQGGVLAADDEHRLAAAKKPSYERPGTTVWPVTAAELRALTRSAEDVKLRETINELSTPKSSTADDSSVMSARDLSAEEKYRRVRAHAREIEVDDASDTRRTQASAAREAKKLVAVIKQFGGPWTREETPQNHPSMFELSVR